MAKMLKWGKLMESPGPKVRVLIGTTNATAELFTFNSGAQELMLLDVERRAHALLRGLLPGVEDIEIQIRHRGMRLTAPRDADSRLPLRFEPPDAGGDEGDETLHVVFVPPVAYDVSGVRLPRRILELHDRIAEALRVSRSEALSTTLHTFFPAKKR